MSIQRYDILHPKMRDKGRFVLYADHIADKDAELHNLLSTLADIRTALGVGEKPMLSDLAGVVRTRMGVIKILERDARAHAAEVERYMDKIYSMTNEIVELREQYVAEVERLTGERDALKAMDRTQCPNCTNCIRDLREDNARLRTERDAAVRERDAAEEALRPFAALDMSPYEGSRDGRTFYQLNETEITVGDIRRARAALAKIEGGRG